jgi:putative immunity protein/bacteriocin
LKKFFALFSVTILFLSGFSIFGEKSASASTLPECKSCTEYFGMSLSDAIKALADDGTTTNLNVTAKEKKEIQKIVKDKEKEYSKKLRDLKKAGFEHVDKADNYVTFTNLNDDANNKSYEKVGVFTEFFINKKTKEFADKQVWIDLKTKEIVRYNLFKANLDGSGNPTELITFDQAAKYENNSGVVTASRFKFSGVSFACSLSGLIACTAAFGGLEVVIPEFGAAVALGCDLAFAAGCATS